MYIVAVLFAAFCMVYGSILYTLHDSAVYEPDYEKIDLNIWQQKDGGGFNNLHEEEYDFLLNQTGLGRDAVDKIVDEAAI